jgi:hypothetical protein
VIQREKFEAVMRELGEDYLYRRDVPGCERNGDYCRQNVQDQWEIWQASRRAALEEIAQLAEGMTLYTGYDVAQSIRALAASDSDGGKDE